MTTLPLDALVAGLRANARGIYATEAAVELLIAHGMWLRRSDFLAACVDHDPEPVGGEFFAWIDWHTVPAFLAEAPCSSGEARLLALAAELVGVPSGRTLDDLLTSLDETNAGRVLDAIAHHLHINRGGAR